MQRILKIKRNSDLTHAPGTHTLADSIVSTRPKTKWQVVKAICKRLKWLDPRRSDMDLNTWRRIEYRNEWQSPQDHPVIFLKPPY